MVLPLTPSDRFGLIRPDLDAHTLGISVVGKMLEDCGYVVYIGNADIAAAITHISKLCNISLLERWIRDHRITRLGFSYRLDPVNAQMNFGKVYTLLKDMCMFSSDGGPLVQLYFAGLPNACYRIEKEYNRRIPVFIGDETQVETLRKLGVPEKRIPVSVMHNTRYDDDRMNFANAHIKRGEYSVYSPPEQPDYREYGSKRDTLVNRINYRKGRNTLPLVRAHVGPYSDNCEEAKKEFLLWLKNLAKTGYLDIVSVGTSQLSQSDFGKDWAQKPNGGGVPVNSENDLYNIWQASRPMLIRIYSATRNVHEMVSIYERTLNMAWYALSFWWFNQIDGRGPNDVLANLHQHIDAISEIAKTGKPFEPNIPHHFAFRGGDDYTYVLSAYLGAIIAKKCGIRYLVLQTMFNTPKYTWGTKDLAKVRALLQLVRDLEDKNFKVFHQPRAGLDYFSPDMEKAKVQLAAVTAMMDDVEPNNLSGPDIIHVVSYCEAVKLATPDVIDDSIKITLSALQEYRKEKRIGAIDDMKKNEEVQYRVNEIYREIKDVVSYLELTIKNLYTPEGFYRLMKTGVFPVPYLWEGKDEFKQAIQYKTGVVNGCVEVIDDVGMPQRPIDRIKMIIK